MEEQVIGLGILSAYVGMLNLRMLTLEHCRNLNYTSDLISVSLVLCV